MEAVWFPLWLVNSFIMSLINIFHVKTRRLNAPWWPKEKKKKQQFANSAVWFSNRTARFPSCPTTLRAALKLLGEKNSDCTQLTTAINNRESRQAAG